MAKTPEHNDRLGQPINLGDCVAYPDNNCLRIGKVVKLNPKMIGLEEVGGGQWPHKGNKYPTDVVILDNSAVTVWLLKGEYK